MDTASHLLFGVTLAGLAHLDPLVSQQPDLLLAVTCGTVLGSQAPDFDTVVRIKGYSAYIRHHRGITHSVPSLVIWPLVITLMTTQLMGLPEYMGSVFLWTFLAVVFHVLLDLLNSYGVQCFRPFTKKWIHVDILSIFEPFLFLIHVAGVGLCLFGNFEAGIVFAWVYGINFLYIGVRAVQHGYQVKKVRESLGVAGICQVTPTFHWFHWTFVVESDEFFYTGKVIYQRVFLEETITKGNTNQIILATIGIDGVRAFLGFAQRVHVTCKELQDGYEVRWSDVRFWYDRKLPFGVDVRLDKNLNVIQSTIGWRKKAWDPPFV